MSEARIRSLEFQLSVCRSTFVDILQTAQLAIEGMDTWPDEMTSGDCKNSKYAPRECACQVEYEGKQ